MPRFGHFENYRIHIFESVYRIEVELGRTFTYQCDEELPKELKIIIDNIPNNALLMAEVRHAGFQTNSIADAICSPNGLTTTVDFREFLTSLEDNRSMTSIMSGGKVYTFMSFKVNGQEFLISEEDIADEEFELLKKSYKQLDYYIKSETEIDAYQVKMAKIPRAPERYNLYYLSRR